jgi:chromosome segregation ATPase
MSVQTAEPTTAELLEKIDDLEETCAELRYELSDEEDERKQAEAERDSYADSLEQAPQAIARAVQVTSLRGPVAGMQYLLDWLDSDDNPTAVDLGQLAYDWLSRWQVSEK